MTFQRKSGSYQYLQVCHEATLILFITCTLVPLPFICWLFNFFICMSWCDCKLWKIDIKWCLISELYGELEERGNELKNSEYASKKEINLQKRLTEARSHPFHQELVWYNSFEVKICNLQSYIYLQFILSFISVENPYQRSSAPSSSRLNQVWVCCMWHIKKVEICSMLAILFIALKSIQNSSIVLYSIRGIELLVQASKMNITPLKRTIWPSVVTYSE
jgi:hypothetical protein